MTIYKKVEGMSRPAGGTASGRRRCFTFVKERVLDAPTNRVPGAPLLTLGGGERVLGVGGSNVKRAQGKISSANLKTAPGGPPPRVCKKSANSIFGVAV